MWHFPGTVHYIPLEPKMSDTNAASDMGTALLVVDVQESFRHRPYYTDAGVGAFVDRVQALIDGCVAKGIPVVQVFHTEDSGDFSMASGHVRTLAPVRIAPALVVHKRAHSALAGTPLMGWFTERGIRRLIVSGIRTEQCCETTTRHASDSGYLVDYVTEATLTFPMTHPVTGRGVSAAEIKDRTELVLSGRFARIMTVEEALAA
jgi:nicotinamidase-related amidase